MNSNESTDKKSPVILIPGVDVEKGISRTGGTIENYIGVLTVFYSDAGERLLLLKSKPDEKTLPAFTTHVHALKSASASIGADEISKKAFELETAAKNTDYEFIEKNLETLTSDISELIINIQEAKTSYNESLSQKQGKDKTIYYKPLLKKLTEALKSKKASSDVFEILDKLNGLQLDAEARETLEKVSYQVLMSEYDDALKIVDEIQEK